MKAKRLELTDFRNYHEQKLEFCDGVNIIYGDNAQGKTNLLEAVYFFTMGKSNRARRDAELIMHDRERAKILLEFSDNTRDNVAEAEIFRDKRKTISVNDIPIRRNSELVRRFTAVYFGPEYLNLVKEGPSARRKNLDILISQIKPGYLAALGELKKIVESKNALLRMEHPNKAMLDIMNEKLVAVSTNIILCRAIYTSRTDTLAHAVQSDISGGKEKLEIKYNSCIGDACGLDADDVGRRLKEKIAEATERELRLCEAVVGPHREDIGFWINDTEAKTYASQGQQKTIVMALKLAEVELIKNETGEMPILLLDDIMSELDRSRREYILNHIKNMQILITCTDTDGIFVPDNACKIEVSSGQAVVR